MKIYLAARYSRQAELRGYADQLRAAGFDVTATWLDCNEASDAAGTPASLRAWAEQDLADVQRSEALIAFTEPDDAPVSSGGRHVEMGYALALGVPVYVVGPPENIFCRLAQMRFDTFGEMLAWLTREGRP